MKIVRTISELKKLVDESLDKKLSIGLVPTMGALHSGHISLVDKARKENDLVVVSVFVNPTQFNNAADLQTYPRTEEADAKLLEIAGADIMFMPSVEEIYPEPDTRQFDLGPVAEVMEGAMRPGHFNGVAQIVSKLFAFVRPTRAYFGEKDFQQIAVIKKMVSLEGFDLEIVSCPIVRDTDGLALSSRNVRLTPEGRKHAPKIHEVLAESVLKSEEMSVPELRKWVVETLNNEPTLKVEYFEIADSLTMQPVNSWNSENQPVGCITVFCGDVRLIDNILYPHKKA